MYDDDLPLPQLSKSSALGLSQTSVGILEPKIDSQSNRALLHSENSKVSGSKSFDSITSSYQRNPIKFAEVCIMRFHAWLIIYAIHVGYQEQQRQ